MSENDSPHTTTTTTTATKTRTRTRLTTRRTNDRKYPCNGEHSLPRCACVCVTVYLCMRHRPSERTFRHSCQFLPIALLSFVFVSERDATPCSRIYARPAADRTNRHKHNRLTVTHYNPRQLRASVSARSECLTSLLAISVYYRYRRSRCVMKQPKNKIQNTKQNTKYNK